MRFSLRAIELCRTKFGKGVFCGFEQTDERILDDISEKSARQDFDELMQNGIIAPIDGDVHISALGQHIFRMMLEPEQYILLDNTLTGICVRIYIRNAYYLCVLEDKTVLSHDSYDRYSFELLPQLELVIGAFIHALHRDEKYISRNPYKLKTIQDIQIIGQSWDIDRQPASKITICGDYFEESIGYQIIETDKQSENKTEHFEGEMSALINKLTTWMFQNISAAIQKEV